MPDNPNMDSGPLADLLGDLKNGGLNMMGGGAPSQLPPSIPQMTPTPLGGPRPPIPTVNPNGLGAGPPPAMPGGMPPLPGGIGANPLRPELINSPSRPPTAPGLPPNLGSMPGVPSIPTRPGTPGYVPQDFNNTAPPMAPYGAPPMSPYGAPPPKPPMGVSTASLADTMKSNVQSGGQLGSVVSPMAAGMNVMSDEMPAGMTDVQEVEVQETVTVNPYDLGQGLDTSLECEETVEKSKTWIAIAAGALVVVCIAFFAIQSAVDRYNAYEDTTETESSEMEAPTEPVPAEQLPAQSGYTGPRIQTATPRSLAVADVFYDDLLAFTKQIQVEGGTVECYLVGTPYNFPEKIKVPVSVEQYNAAVEGEILEIQYQIIKISGIDYVTNIRIKEV